MLMPQPESAPRIGTPLPGPRAEQMIAKDLRYTSPSYTRVYPLAVARGSGAVLEDVDGNRFLDFTAGIAVCATGHSHPRVVQAITRQARDLLHMSGTDFYYGTQADLAAKLAEIVPGDEPRRVFFCNSGAEAVEAAIKLARYHTGRHRLIAFRGAFHGRTLGAVSLTASKAVQRRGFGPLIPGVTHIEYPRAARRGESADRGAEAVERTFAELQRVFATVAPPEEVAAIVVEPIQGEGGYLVPPDNFLPRLHELAQRHEILLITDEVQSGMGRTGKMFAQEHVGVAADILCLAKGIASGMPLGAIVAREDVMTWPPGAHASTFGGNPVSCAAALETIALLEEGLIENARQVGGWLREQLQQRLSAHPNVIDVRGRGMMIGVELARDSRGEPHPELCNALIQACFEKGLLLLSCGASTIRFCPPLVIDAEQAETGARIFADTLDELAG